MISGSPTGILHDTFMNNGFSAKNNFHSVNEENRFRTFFPNYYITDKILFNEFYHNKQSSMVSNWKQFFSIYNFYLIYFIIFYYYKYILIYF